MMKDYLQKLYEKAVHLNHENIFNLLEKNSQANFLDLGCDDGKLSLKLAAKIGTKNIYGVEIMEEKIKIAEKNSIKIKNFDLNGRFNFDDNFFDIINANQVIEHLCKSDNFLSEIHRILKPGGYAIISTENASSWCNIFASIMGWQIFSLTNISNSKHGIGNPLSLHRAETADPTDTKHITIFNFRGLKELLEIHGFKVIKITGSGYFPLPSALGNLDKIHCHFMTFKIRR